MPPSMPRAHRHRDRRRWTQDTVAASTVRGGQVVVNASVPPYDVQVYVFDATAAWVEP